MTIDRRTILGTGAGLGIAATAIAKSAVNAEARTASKRTFDYANVSPNAGSDVSATLQRELDNHAETGNPVYLAPGEYRLEHPLNLPSGTKLIGAHGTTKLTLFGPQSRISSRDGQDISLESLAIDGAATARTNSAGLVDLHAIKNLSARNLKLTNAPGNALTLSACSGTVSECEFKHIATAAIFSNNAQGLAVTQNLIHTVADNGILIWRDRAGVDGTIVAHNRISHIAAASGGSGQNGNAVNVFRANNVLVHGNVISDCAYSAIRANAASDVQIIANNCMRLGEVAIYAEFAFEGAQIAQNTINGAATGISVTNFKEGGRLAVVQGNLVRNLFRREHEPIDKRGVGIGVEADTTVVGNVIENAPTAAITLGWGPWLRNLSVTGNVIRGARIGLGISKFGALNSVSASSNQFSNISGGAIQLLAYHRTVGAPLSGDQSGQSQHTNLPALHGNLIS